jgi:hypothetical protein
MKERFRLVQLGNRGGTFYCKDNITGSRTSLETKNRDEAKRLVQHKNEAKRQPLLNRKIGMAYLAGTDSGITKRSWQDVMADIIKDKQGPTLHRWNTAIRDKAFNHTPRHLLNLRKAHGPYACRSLQRLMIFIAGVLFHSPPGYLHAAFYIWPVHCD